MNMEQKIQMDTVDKYLYRLYEYKQRHAVRYGITRMGIFGSVARGEHSEGSDVDVVIESSPISLLTLVGIKYELENLFGVPVDVVRIHDRMNPRFRKRISKEAIYV
jgi:predicted nucleotidyltransferase